MSRVERARRGNIIDLFWKWSLYYGAGTSIFYYNEVINNMTEQNGKSPRKVHLRTFGCQMNEYDSEVMAGLFELDGWIITDNESEADVIILNTCSVRQHAEDRVWGALYDLRERAEREPSLIIGVCGCMAQGRAKDIARNCPHVRLIAGTHAFSRLPELVEETSRSGRTVVDIDASRIPRVVALPRKRKSQLKAFVPVMRGCENYCAYCVVPYVRGPEISRSVEEVVAEVEALARDGCREVTLLGQNVNSYLGPRKNGGAGSVSFAGLLRMIGGVNGIMRIRFITSHPKDFPDELIRAMAEVPAVCEHLHLPLQSGSDRVLDRMNRKYTFGSYRELVGRIRGAIPGIALSTDIIVGFPGETEEDYNRTAQAMEEIGFESAFIFKYSDREKTRAAELEPKVAQIEIVRRHAELLKLQEGISAERNRGLIGARLELLVEGYSPRNPERLFGRTRTNKRAVFEGGEHLIGTLVCVTIREVTPLTLIGDLS